MKNNYLHTISHLLRSRYYVVRRKRRPLMIYLNVKRYQETNIDVNILTLKNKIRFLLGIMIIEERHEMIYYHYMEDYYGDYDW